MSGLNLDNLIAFIYKEFLLQNFKFLKVFYIESDVKIWNSEFIHESECHISIYFKSEYVDIVLFTHF